MYAVIAKSIYVLIMAFDWTKECDTSFEKIKQALISAPILKSLDYSKIFNIHVDASTYAIGCILSQPRDNIMDFPICYASRQLNAAQRNYSTIE